MGIDFVLQRVCRKHVCSQLMQVLCVVNEDYRRASGWGGFQETMFQIKHVENLTESQWVWYLQGGAEPVCIFKHHLIIQNNRKGDYARAEILNCSKKKEFCHYADLSLAEVRE